MTLQTEPVNKQKIREQVAVTNCFQFCTDLFKICKAGYKSINMTELVKNHDVEYDTVTALKNLNIVKSIGQARDTMHYWAGPFPDINMASKLVVEIRRIKTNRQLAKLPATNRKLIPIIKPTSFTAVECLQILKSMHRDFPDGALIDSKNVTREHNIPDGFFPLLETLGVVKQSQIAQLSNMYIWVGETPSLKMAELVHDEIMKPVHVEEPEVEEVKKSEPVLKMLHFLSELKQKLGSSDSKVSMTAMIKEHNILTSLGQVLQTINIVKKTGEKGPHCRWKWIYDGDINMDLAEMVHKELYKDRQKYFGKKPVHKAEQVTKQAEQVVIPEAHTPSEKNAYMQSLIAEEKRLQDFLSELPEYKKLTKLRQMIKLAQEIELTDFVTDDFGARGPVEAEKNYLGSFKGSKTGSTIQKILTYVNTQHGEIKTVHVTEMFPEISYPTIAGHLKTLVDTNRILRIRHGLYKSKR